MNYYKILLQIPNDLELIYFSKEIIKIGSRVEVFLGSRKMIGIVYSQTDVINPKIEYKKINRVIDNEPVFNNRYLTFLSRLSSYYHSNISLSFMKLVPKSILESEKINFEFNKKEKTEFIELTKEQKDIFEKIRPYLNKGYSTHLIQGVTGSGKTEIYMELAEELMSEGKQVLYLVPEISLTSQLIKRLSKRLGLKLSAYHSKLSPKRRKEVFWGFVNGDIKFLVGARSALFIPANNIGLIIVDEEHEFSYKQEDSPHYHLRDMAVLYASILKTPIILGSATPSIASYYNVKKGKYNIYILETRYNRQILPNIEIIDMKNTDIIENILSTELYDKLYNCIKKNEQAILLLNRKGYSSHLICQKCGSNLTCPNCSVSMVYYKSSNYARCSYCNESISFFKCGKCGANDFINYGYGTEKAFELLDNLFKDKVLKIDMDDISSQKKLDKMLSDFANKKYNILIGTQIIAKGLNFEDVTLVGVLNIDHQFALPDFRASERAYQLLMQVAGRAGRFSKKGVVAIQTFNTEENVFSMLNKDSAIFYEYELNRRKLFSYPPFSRLIRVDLFYTNIEDLKKASNSIALKLKKIENLDVLGPAPAPVFKIKNKFRYNILLKSNSKFVLDEACDLINRVFNEQKKGSMQIRIDVDPYNFI